VIDRLRTLKAGHINDTRTAIGKELATGDEADCAFRGTADRLYVGTVTQTSLGGSMYIPSPARHLQRLACTILLLAALVVGEAAGQSSAPLSVPDENAAARAKRLDALFAGLRPAPR